MANKMKKCTICGSEYHYCGKCKHYGGYRFYACKPECYQVWSILSSLREGVINSHEAAVQFSNIGITIDSDLSGYLEAVAKGIKQIIETGTTVKTNKKTVKTEKE